MKEQKFSVMQCVIVLTPLLPLNSSRRQTEVLRDDVINFEIKFSQLFFQHICTFKLSC